MAVAKEKKEENGPNVLKYFLNNENYTKKFERIKKKNASMFKD